MLLPRRFFFRVFFVFSFQLLKIVTIWRSNYPKLLPTWQGTATWSLCGSVARVSYGFLCSRDAYLTNHFPLLLFAGSSHGWQKQTNQTRSPPLRRDVHATCGAPLWHQEGQACWVAPPECIPSLNLTWFFPKKKPIFPTPVLQVPC